MPRVRTRHAPLREPLERFMAKVAKTDTCWLWTGSLGGGGYGKFHAGVNEQTMRGILVPSHRWAYEYFVGPIPAGLELDHLCRVRACVNPTHLEPVTHLENIRRAGPHLGNPHPPLPFCGRGHALAGTPNLYVAPNGRRRCRECDRVTKAARQTRTA